MGSGFVNFFFSPFGVALPLAVAGLLGLSSLPELRPVVLFGLSSRLPVGLLNTIFFFLRFRSVRVKGTLFWVNITKKNKNFDRFKNDV